MLKMRLQRVGRKHEPTFRLVLTDSKNSTKSGKFLEILGSFDARKTTDQFKVDRIKHWLEKGIMPTDTVHNLLVTHKIIDAKKKNVLPKKTPIVKAAPVEEKAPEAPVVETPVEAVTEAEAPAEVVMAETAPAVVAEPETVTEPTVEAPVDAPAPEEPAA